MLDFVELSQVQSSSLLFLLFLFIIHFGALPQTFTAGKGNGLKASGGNAVDRDQGNMSAYEWAQSAGGNKSHNNMPPYYALAYVEYVG